MNFNLLRLLALRYGIPPLGGTGVKELKKLKHPVIESQKKFTKASKLCPPHLEERCLTTLKVW
jgi:hypothetical protein